MPDETVSESIHSFWLGDALTVVDERDVRIGELTRALDESNEKLQRWVAKVHGR